jgi:hypothetical protein
MPPAPRRGPAIDVFSFSGGRCRTYRQHLPGAHCRRFLALMVGAPGSSAPIGPTYEFVASPEVGPRASVGTLKTGYHCIQVLNQDKEQCVHPALPRKL